ncbi:hypothetical protein ACHQM5_018872 [Ranunculus cassubicifolius]
MAFAGRFKELFKKYGKVAFGVHMSVSAASITGLYVAIKNNVDVGEMLEKVGISSVSKEEAETLPPPETIPIGDDVKLDTYQNQDVKVPKKNRTAEMAASSGGALALAILCNKALFPARVPITIALTPPIARFLARRKIIKGQM